MTESADQKKVESWLEPVMLGEMLATLRKAGFSGDVYRGCFADLEASLDDDEAGALHFLRYGYAEGRIFRTGLDLAGLDRLQRLHARNRFYIRNILTALVTAWTGTHVRSIAELAAHGGRIERLRAMGGVPVLILGDHSADLYRRSANAGDRWICPLAMAPLEGFDALLATSRQALLPQQAMPTIWKFGQSDMQDGWLAYRLRAGIGQDDHAAFLAYAEPWIAAYTTFLADMVPAASRPSHWIAALFPPAWQAKRDASSFLVEVGAEAGAEAGAEVGADSLPARTAMHHAFNQRLEQAARPLGFNLLADFEPFLNAHGVVDDCYLVPLRDSPDLDYRATNGILSTSLWNIVGARATTAPPVSIRDQFAGLLEEIRRVQMGIE